MYKPKHATLINNKSENPKLGLAHSTLQSAKANLIHHTLAIITPPHHRDNTSKAIIVLITHNQLLSCYSFVVRLYYTICDAFCVLHMLWYNANKWTKEVPIVSDGHASPLREIAPIVNQLCCDLKLDAIYAVGILFTLELIKSKYESFILQALFSEPIISSTVRLSHRIKPRDVTKTTSKKVTAFNTDDFTWFINSRAYYPNEELEKQHVLSTFERAGLGYYDVTEDKFYYTGNEATTFFFERSRAVYGSHVK